MFRCKLRSLASVSLILFLFASCARTDERHALSDQILRPRPGHFPYLTNKAYEVSAKDFVVKHYDLRDPKFRKLARKLKIVCKIGKQRWQICKKKPGFCRQTFRIKSSFFKKSKRKRSENYLAIEREYDYLLASKVKCFSSETRNFILM